MNVAMSPEEFRRQQQSLSEALKEEQQRRAEEQRQTGYQSLAEQMRQHRLGMQQSRGALSEQGWAARRNIQQQAQAQGLGTSGLRDLSLVQSQMAQGRQMSELEAQNTAVQRSAMEARQGIDRETESSLRSAELSAREGAIQAEREAMAMEDSRREKLLTLYQMAQDENTTPEMLKQLAQAMFADVPEAAQDIEAAVGGMASDPYGDLRWVEPFGSSFDWGEFGASTGAGMLAGGVGGPLGSVIGGLVTGGTYLLTTMTGDDGTITLKNPSTGQKVDFTNWNEAVKQVDEWHAGKEGSDQIKAFHRTGVRDSIRFKYRGSTYKTYNEALEAYRMYANR
jgi:hypothetical protein